MGIILGPKVCSEHRSACIILILNDSTRLAITPTLFNHEHVIDVKQVKLINITNLYMTARVKHDRLG